jgi:regulatory protein
MAAVRLSLKGRALRLLSMREHSRLELGRKLARHAEESDDIDALLDALEAANWLSQQRFSEALIHRRAASYGNHRIVAELHSHGLSGDGEQLASLAQDETLRACKVWRKKFGSVAQDQEQRAKQVRFLMQRGFSQRAIAVAIKGLEPE